MADEWEGIYRKFDLEPWRNFHGSTLGIIFWGKMFFIFWGFLGSYSGEWRWLKKSTNTVKLSLTLLFFAPTEKIDQIIKKLETWFSKLPYIFQPNIEERIERLFKFISIANTEPMIDCNHILTKFNSVQASVWIFGPILNHPTKLVDLIKVLTNEGISTKFDSVRVSGEFEIMKTI